MSIELSTLPRQHFIDWVQLPLPAAAKWLADQFADPVGKILDLSGVSLVVPTARVQRRMVELLLTEAQQRSLVFTPAKIQTIGTFPEDLYRSEKPLASDLVQNLAWVHALRNTDPAKLREFTGRIPQDDDSVGWQEMARVLRRWHNELAGNGLTFKDVLSAGQKLDFFQESKRWQALSDIQRAYWKFLRQHDIWDKQNARLLAVKNNECQTNERIFLVGTVDLNPIVRSMIEQIREQVTAIVFGDPLTGDRFDELGCLKVEPWLEAEIPVHDRDIVVGEQPLDQARLVARFLRGLNGEYGIDQISIGVADQRLVSVLNRTLIQSQVKTHDAGGESIGHSPTFVLLELMADWLGDQRFESFAALVRHPDLYEWLTNRLDTDQWLFELDQYQNNRLPFSISTDINKTYFGGKDHKGRDRYANLELAYKEVYELVLPLISPAEKPMDQWAMPWRQVLVAIYRDVQLDRKQPGNRRNIRACQKIVRALIEIEESGHLLAGDVSSVDALQWALDLCSQEFVADPAVSDAISMVGWLDAAWEDTPVAIITNVNDGMIPSSEGGNLFLPNSIRSQLGLVDNRRRYARDAYALNLILASREKVLLCVGRHDEDGQPLLPSRLLMTGDTDLIAKRASRLFQPGADTSGWVSESHNQRPGNQQFVIPDPTVGQDPINSMRVTDFRQYLACPYRFYLSRVLGIERLEDNKDELDAAQFGSLIHDVVENFGRSKIRGSSDAAEIQAHLIDCLNRYSLARYGRTTVPTVQIQLEQARLRLVAFANWQAEHRKQGYEIYEVEREKTRREFDLDGEPFQVRGQIDRIDVNHDRKMIGLYDYKTGDKGEPPEKTHRNPDGSWKDLQLPLYHHLLDDFDLPSGYAIETGLILIAKDTDQVRLAKVDWSPQELASADQAAFEIMRKVRDGQFWPPADMNAWWDEYAAICQASILEKWSPNQSEDDVVDDAPDRRDR